jgi:hypothetical protein
VSDFWAIGSNFFLHPSDSMMNYQFLPKTQVALACPACISSHRAPSCRHTVLAPAPWSRPYVAPAPPPNAPPAPMPMLDTKNKENTTPPTRPSPQTSMTISMGDCQGDEKRNPFAAAEIVAEDDALYTRIHELTKEFANDKSTFIVMSTNGLAFRRKNKPKDINVLQSPMQGLYRTMKNQIDVGRRICNGEKKRLKNNHTLCPRIRVFQWLREDDIHTACHGLQYLQSKTGIRFVLTTCQFTKNAHLKLKKNELGLLRTITWRGWTDESNWDRESAKQQILDAWLDVIVEKKSQALRYDNIDLIASFDMFWTCDDLNISLAMNMQLICV